MRIDSQPIHSGPFLISFSGVDGAGKSTQIGLLCDSLERLGFRVQRLIFWDHIAVCRRLREQIGRHAATFYDRKQPVANVLETRNHKYVRKAYLTVARAVLCLLDALRLRRLLRNRRIANSDVIVFDRYIYDQLANIYSRSLASRACMRMLQKLTPRPDLAFILDVSPAEAFARKPEYPLDFVYENRRAFLGLQELFPELIPVSASSIVNVRNEIYSHIQKSQLAEFAIKPIVEEPARYDCSPAT